MTAMELYNGIRQLVADNRRDIIGEFPSAHQPASALSAFLNKHFPAVSGWGTMSVRDVIPTLRSHLEHAK